MIGASEHLLSQDKDILAVAIMDSRFNTIETAAKEDFGKQFKLTKEIQDNAGAWAAMMYEIARLSDETFGETSCIVVHHDNAKLVLLKISPQWMVGLVLSSTTNVDYVTLKIRTILNSQEALRSSLGA